MHEPEQNRRALSPDDRDRLQAARAEARAFGYMLLVDDSDDAEPATYTASAALAIEGQATMARRLASGASVGDAAEAGLEQLRRIVQGDSWPNEDAS